MKYLFFILIFYLTIYNCQSQDYAEIISDIEINKDIRFNIPTEADFVRYSNYDMTYNLSPVKDSILANIDDSGIAFNPHISYSDETNDPELVADYITSTNSENFTFKFVNWGNRIAVKIGEEVGIRNDTVFIPEVWKEFIGNEKITEIWFQSTVRIDSRGFPLEKKKSVKPIFLKTNKGNYKIEISIQKSNVIVLPMLAQSYTGYVLRDCTSDSNTTDDFINDLKDLIIEKLKNSPIEATINNDLTIPESETWLKREYKRSIVLGIPHYEISAYIIKINKAYDGAKCYITQSLVTSVGVNGTYSEPSNEEFSKYKDVIQKIVSSSIKEICKKMNYIYNNNICKCN